MRSTREKIINDIKNALLSSYKVIKISEIIKLSGHKRSTVNNYIKDIWNNIFNKKEQL